MTSWLNDQVTNKISELREDRLMAEVPAVQKQQCPLCENEDAEFVHPKGDFVRYKRFSCKRCRVFVISLETERDLLKGNLRKYKSKLSGISQSCPEGMVLYIWVERGLISVSPLG
jgi:transposase-like protein